MAGKPCGGAGFHDRAQKTGDDPAFSSLASVLLYFLVERDGETFSTGRTTVSSSQVKQFAEPTHAESIRVRQVLLNKHIRNLSLPHSQPALYGTLSVLLNAADPLRQDMEESLDQLKEAFLSVMYEILAEADIDMQERLVLGLGGEVLRVMDRAHPQADEVDALLADTPMLATVLRQIAADTLMLRSLNALGQAFALCREAVRPDQDEEVESYQVCLKGQLSHFYYA